MSAESDLKDLVKTFTESRKEAWGTVKLEPDLLRGGLRPLGGFYDKANELCRNGPDAVAAWRIVAGSRVRAQASKLVPRFLTTRKDEIGAQLGSVRTDEIRATLKGTVEKFLKDEGNPGDTEAVERIYRAVEGWHSAGFDPAYLGKYLEHLELLDRASDVAEHVIGTVSRPLRATASEDDWAALARWVQKPVEGRPWCSLIHCYWLDEAGLPLVVERIVDRVENGQGDVNRLLSAIRVAEDSKAARLLGQFACFWQQGLTPAVDERRRQYEALYGLPLHVGAGWGRLDTVDSNQAFPGAFHGFLSEALKFYQELRNRFMDADPIRAKESLHTLSQVLRRGNENLELVRSPQIRASMEYSKRILGGDRKCVQTFDVELQKEWKGFLPGRPGVRGAMDPWEFAVETVSNMLGWRRPPIGDFGTLAEDGELILTLIRIVSDMNSQEGPNVGELLAFLDLMQEPIQRYAGAYRSVARVDLQASQPFLGPPAEAMARHIPPPIVPPLRRNWADVPVAG